LEGAIKDGRRSPDTFFTLGLVNLYDGDYNSAIQQAEAALNQRPDYPQAELLFGDALSGRAVRTQLMVSADRRRHDLLEARSHVESSVIEDDFQSWQQRHNEFAKRALVRIQQALRGL